MSNRITPIIEVERVSKTFLIRPHAISLRHELSTQVRNMFSAHKNPTKEVFNALNDVSFTVNRGESLGIVGQNGAGKTTLLRILSGIVRPTSGRVTLRGNFASVIGVGAGFIETMPGRKNIYLNAAIHGVSPAQIEDKVADIIEFADIGKYIDMPVKDYSNGMRARLGFSIAVHTLPDIVFLDEVLAVGDAAFQKKSKARLLNLLARQKTVVFVSHSTSSILEVCQRAIWLHKGKILLDADARTVVSEYDAFMNSIDNLS